MQRLQSIYPEITILVITHRAQTIPAGFKKIDLTGGAIYEVVR
jgi:hypothetical protein